MSANRAAGCCAWRSGATAAAGSDTGKVVVWELDYTLRGQQ